MKAILYLAFVSLYSFELPSHTPFSGITDNQKSFIKNPFLPKYESNVRLTVRRRYFACDFSTQKFALESFTLNLDTSIVLVKHLYPLPEFRLGVKF